jgi:Spy/CpxP family protein refolding chaperone
MKLKVFMVCLLALLLSATIFGQTSQPPQTPQGNAAPGQPGDAPSPRAARHDHHMFVPPGIPMGMPMGGPPMGKWWKNAEVVQKLQLSDDQLQRLEKIFQDSRLRLIDLHAALEKEEAQLEPLVEAENPDEGQVNSQIDKVAAARAELEKGNTRMLLELRKVLTTEQWKTLQTMPPRFCPMEHMRMHPDMPAPPPTPKAPQQ